MNRSTDLDVQKALKQSGRASGFPPSQIDYVYRGALHRKPGFVGRFPYLLLLRCGMISAIIVRLFIHPERPATAGAVAVPLVMLVFALLAHRRASTRKRSAVSSLSIAVDIIGITVAYYLTNQPRSDFVLFYYVPIFTAAEYHRRAAVTATAIAASLGLLCAVLALSWSSHWEGTTTEIITEVYAPRIAFYLTPCVVTAFILRGERITGELANFRRQNAQSLNQFRASLEDELDFESGIRSASKLIKETLPIRVVYGVNNRSTSNGVLARRVVTHFTGISAGGQLGEEVELLAKLDAVGLSSKEFKRIPIKCGVEEIGVLYVETVSADLLEFTKEYLFGIADAISVVYERSKLFETLRTIGEASSSAAQFSDTLNAILDEIVNERHFEYATISLIDPYLNSIRTVRGRNVPGGWISKSKYHGKQNDILWEVARSGQARVVSEWNSSLNWEIFQRYNHKRLARIYAPIVTVDGGVREVVGVIEAGCDKARRAVVLDPNYEAVVSLGERFGANIVKTSPLALVKLIAAKASELARADSSSLHMYQFGEQFLVAGSGLVTKEFLHRFPPRPDGFGARARGMQAPFVASDLERTHPELHLAGVRAIAAFAIQLDQSVFGYLYLHSWKNNHYFTARELELVKAMVPHVVVAVRHSLQLHDASRADDKAWLATGLQATIRSLSTNLSVDALVTELASNAIFLLDAKSVVLFLYDQATRSVVPGAKAGRFNVPELVDLQPGGVSLRVIALGRSIFASNAKANEILCPIERSGINAPFVERENIASTAAIILKEPFSGEVVGVLFVNFDELQDFEGRNHGKRELCHALGAAAAVAIKTAHLHVSDLNDRHAIVSRRERELAALALIGSVIVSGATKFSENGELGEILAHVLSALRRQGDVVSGYIYVWEPDKSQLRLKAYRGERACPLGALESGQGIAGICAKERRTQHIRDAAELQLSLGDDLGGASAIAVPMLKDGQLVGVMAVSHGSVHAFTEKDVEFLENVAVHVQLALYIALQEQRIRTQLQQTLALSIVTAKMQSQQANLNLARRFALTGITASRGLGFSRAALFEVDSSKEKVTGTVGIGGLDRVEAEGAWDVPDWPIEKMVELAAAFEGTLQRGAPDSKFGEAVRSTSVDFPAFETLISDPAVGIKDIRKVSATEVARVLPSLYGDSPNYEVWLVPLLSEGMLKGGLLVDNRFLLSERQIQSGCEPILIAFAEVLTMAIESSFLRDKLADEKALANWRAELDDVTHLLKAQASNASSLLGLAMESLGQSDVLGAERKVQEAHNQFLAMLQHIRRNEIRGTQRNINRRRVDLKWVLRHAARTCPNESGCSVEVAGPDAAYVHADPEMVLSIFSELINNADRALAANGTESPKVEISVTVGPVAEFVIVTVHDNGPGINEELLGGIFKTNVQSKSSSGLGLRILAQQVEANGGSVSYERRDGALFTVKLPKAEKRLPEITTRS